MMESMMDGYTPIEYTRADLLEIWLAFVGSREDVIKGMADFAVCGPKQARQMVAEFEQTHQKEYEPKRRANRTATYSKMNNSTRGNTRRSTRGARL